MPKIQDVFIKLSGATPEMLGRVNDLLDGRLEVPRASSVDIRSISISDAARQCGVARGTMYRLVESGKVATVRLPGGAPRILHSSLVDYMLGSRAKA